MASFTIGSGGDRADIETAASDPVSNPVGTPTEWYYLEDQIPVANVATINTNVTVYSNGYKTDTSKIASGICLQGGTWVNADIRRYNNTAAVVIQNASIDESSVYTPLQDGAVVGCTGDLNAVTTLSGGATGLTGVDNKFVVNVSGVPGAYKDAAPGLYFDGIDDYVDSGVSGVDIRDRAIRLYFVQLRNTGTFDYLMDWSPFGDGGFIIRVDDDLRVLNGFIFREPTGSSSISGPLVEVYGRYDTYIYYKSSGVIELVANGVEYTNPYDGTFKEPVTQGIIIGATVELGGNNEMIMCCCSIEGLFSYISAGDFGSATLVDHSGNGNDGTINGATWILTTEDPLTPKIGGSLLITSGPNKGLYAGGTQPSKGINKYNFSYTYGW